MYRVYEAGLQGHISGTLGTTGMALMAKYVSLPLVFARILKSPVEGCLKSYSMTLADIFAVGRRQKRLGAALLSFDHINLSTTSIQIYLVQSNTK
jgi:hypothetical protein